MDRKVQQAADKLARVIEKLARRHSETQLATVRDIGGLSDGYIICRLNGSDVRVSCRTNDTIQVDDYVYIRQMTVDKTSWYIYDGFGKYATLPSGWTDTYRPKPRP